MTYIKTMLDYVFVVATFLLFSCPAVISSKKLITLKSKSSNPSHPVHFRELHEPFKRQFHKMAKHTQTIRRQFADELFECVWLFCGIGALRVTIKVNLIFSHFFVLLLKVS